MRAVLRTTGALTGLGATLTVLIVLGNGPLEVPPVDWSAWSAWMQARDPALAAVAVLRLGALAAGWYLLAVTLAAGIAHGLDAPGLARAVALVTVPSLRRLQQALLGAGVAAAMSTAAAATPVLALAEPRVGVGVVELEMVDHPATAPSHLPAPTGGGSPAVDDPVPATWTVAPGEHFWSIAERVVAGATRRPAEDRQVASYWRALVERNRKALVDQNNPDLVLPGQVFVLPPVAEA